jgi:hypothetical protein
VKLEQASKVKLRMPIPLRLGEGRAGREETDKHLFRSAGVVSTACAEGDLGNWGRSAAGGDRNSNAIVRVVARAEVGEGHTTEEAG